MIRRYINVLNVHGVILLLLKLREAIFSAIVQRCSEVGRMSITVLNHVLLREVQQYGVQQTSCTHFLLEWFFLQKLVLSFQSVNFLEKGDNIFISASDCTQRSAELLSSCFHWVLDIFVGLPHTAFGKFSKVFACYAGARSITCIYHFIRIKTSWYKPVYNVVYLLQILYTFAWE